MVTRDELIEVAWLAYDKARSVDDGIADAIDVVEPLIRADERERTNTVGGHRQIREEGRADMCNDLRAKVEALPGAPASGSGWIARDDVLALLDGGSE